MFVRTLVFPYSIFLRKFMFHIAVVESIHSKAIELIKNNKHFSFELIENIQEDNLINKLKKCDAIALRTAKLTDKIINSCEKLKIVSRHGVGYDNVDINSLNKKGIPLTITIHANAITVAEHVIAMMFYFNKKLHDFDKSVRNNKWNQLKIIDQQIITTNSELFNKTILILGFGRIGKELSKRCKAFGMQVLVFDPYVDKEIIEEYNSKKIITIDEGIGAADYLSVHIPLSSETKNLINNKVLGKMIGYEIIRTQAMKKERMTLINKNIKKIIYYYHLLQMVEDLDGSIVECGVGAGKSILMLASLSQLNPPERKIYGYDTFEGFPTPTEIDEVGIAFTKRQSYPELDVVIGKLNKHGLDSEYINNNITFTKGLFKDTLPQYTGGPISLLNLDCDLYLSYMDQKYYL